MNRMQSWPSGAVSVSPFFSRMDRAQVDLSPSRSPDCTLLVPHHYEPGYEYPLLVWLHGPGDDERQLRTIMPHVSLRNFVAVGPRGCSLPLPGEGGFRWNQTLTAIEAAEQQVFDSIEAACARFRIAASQVFLAGFQCGGTMALRIGLQHPERFAGIASIGGPFPEGAAPLARLRHLRGLPLLIAQGRDSLEYPLQQTCDELRLFHMASLHVSIRQYPVGDELTTAMLSDLNAWLMEQVTGVCQESSEEISCCRDGRN